MGFSVFNRDEMTFKYPILFNQFERVFMISVFFDFFIYDKSIYDAAEGVSVPLERPRGSFTPNGSGTGATIC
jgi:hypothetical protein